MKTGFWSLFCLICFLLTSCSLPRTAATPDTASPDKRGGRLLNIRIERWDTVRFSGLLGLRRDAAGGLTYVLLDATGVKLLQVQVAKDGSHNLLRVGGPLKKSNLAPFLSEALARIYLQEPNEMPCDGSWFYRLCREESDGNGWNKYGQAGPFKIWQVSASRVRGTSGKDDEAVVYRQPWLGVSISLKRADSGI